MINSIVKDIQLNYPEQCAFEYAYKLFKNETKINSDYLNKLQGYCDCLNTQYEYIVNPVGNFVFLVRCTKIENARGFVDDFKIIMFWEFEGACRK